MKNIRKYLLTHGQLLGWVLVALIALWWLLLNRLGSLTPGGLSPVENSTAVATYGWHGLYSQPFYLPLNVLRTVVFWISGHHGQLLTRLPNAIFGALTILTFAWLLKLWHGTRTAVFATVLFATGAWILHVSRLASTDVLYLWATPTLLLGHMALQKRPDRALIFYGTMLLWGLLLYIPGVVWLVGLTIYWQRQYIKQGWIRFGQWWQRSLYVLAGAIWLPLLIINLSRPRNLATWLGLPHHLAAPLTLLKQFGDVFVHLFVHGPQYPQLWLVRAPLFDIFTLALSLIGIYFYGRHWKMSRSRWLGSFFAIGVLLVALGGPVSLSIVVPLIYLAAATGIAFLLHDWLSVFPINPLARGLGIGLIVVAIGFSSLYNLRAYFVAWPHNSITKTTFRYHR